MYKNLYKNTNRGFPHNAGTLDSAMLVLYNAQFFILCVCAKRLTAGNEELVDVDPIISISFFYDSFSRRLVGLRLFLHPGTIITPAARFFPM